MLLDGIRLDRTASTPLRRQLAYHLEARILGGQIRPGRRLPSVRRVAELLGLHRNTVSAAYRDLIRKGLARSRPGSGVYVQLSGTGNGAAPALLVPAGPATFSVQCEDLRLSRVLCAELASRLSLDVQAGHAVRAAGVEIRLAPAAGFIRSVTCTKRPAVVVVISDSDVVQRLASATVLIQSGEGIGYLPAAPSAGPGLDRVARQASVVFADHSTLPAARARLGPGVRPLSIVSEYSYGRILRFAYRHEACQREAARASGAAEPSTTPGGLRP